MTLWLPLLDYARSYALLVHRTMAVLEQPSCVEVVGLSRGQIAAFQFHGHLVLQPVSPQVSCPWLLVNKDAEMTSSAIVDISGWRLHSTIRHPIDRDEDVLIYQRWAQALN
jgi:hypothetical protein